MHHVDVEFLNANIKTQFSKKIYRFFFGANDDVSIDKLSCADHLNIGNFLH